MKRKLIITMFLFLAIALVGCKKKNENQLLLNEVYNLLSIETSINAPIDLPKEMNGTTITWETSEPLVISKNGEVYLYDESHTATLTATITYGDLQKNKSFEVTVLPISDNTIDLAWHYYSSKLSPKIINDLPLITKDYYGTSVTYASQNTSILTDDGKVTQSLVDQETVFYIYITKGKLIKMYEYNITVGGFTDAQKVNITKEKISKSVDQLMNGEITQLPTNFDYYGTEVNWYSNTQYLITNNGYIIPPLVKKDYEINCRIVCGSKSSLLKFILKDFGGNTTVNEQRDIWIKSLIPTSIHGVKNYLVASGDEYYLDYQVETERNAVLNLISGQDISINKDYFINISDSSKEFVNRFYGSGTFNTSYHPKVSQNTLDAKFYEGYKMPNDQNILYIVCHESGMPYEKNNAEYLANIQFNNAFSNKNAREASWNYQVDAYGIYQSFDDSVICWHAGDGTHNEATGNNNGIGIEMCINQDGNYEGALYNNAKLVANLMHKYNLKLENVKRHYDFSGKECPSYMIRTGRWNEFLEMVDREYQAIALLKGAKVEWSLSTSTSSNTNQILDEYFTKGAHGLYFQKPISTNKTITISLKVTFEDGKVISYSKDLILKKDEKPE